MNSVISAFKTKKSNAPNSTSAAATSNVATSDGKQNGGLGGLSISTVGGVIRKKPVAQDNGYQYLRQIREIETANKLLSPVVSVAADDQDKHSADMLHFRPAIDAAYISTDVVDHYAPAMVRLSSGNSHSDDNMNGKPNNKTSRANVLVADNGNMDIFSLSCDRHSPAPLDDDDNSDHSMAACTSTSSSSEHSNSTVVHSPTVINANPLPTTSCNTYLESNSTLLSSASSASCQLLSISVNGDRPSTSSTTLSSLSSEDPLVECTPNVTKEGNANYSPAFLKTSPVTLPLSSPNTKCSRSSSSTPTISSASSTPKHVRYSKPRLTLSSGINQSMPSVHGRPNLSFTSSTSSQMIVNLPKRISTHQRNLSLDFRSMGIMLPHVSQVTNTRINHTQHHRNRSLDSALQRIPEVEISSPNTESETTFCSPSSILNSNMCSKIVTTAASVTAALSTSPPLPALTFTPATNCRSEKVSTLGLAINPAAPSVTVHVQPIQSLPSEVVDSCPQKRRPKSNESVSTGTQVVVTGSNGGCSDSSNSLRSAGSNKKREDLTSLGSDDSGILCGSESDQISLSRICHSHESLDSGEIDGDGDANDEKNCIDVTETTSMDNDYNLMESELCFFPSHTVNELDCLTLRPSRKQKEQIREQAKIATQQEVKEQRDADNRMRNRVMNMSQASIILELGTTHNVTARVLDEPVANLETLSTPQTNTISSMASAGTTPTMTQAALPTPLAPPTENTKNEQVLFKNFFGATKNAIFRTAQSIIENHEKKNAAKLKISDPQENSTGSILVSTTLSSLPHMSMDSVKSPTDISKKKEFFSLLTSSSSTSKKAAAAATAATSTTTLSTTCTADRPLDSTNSNFTLDSCKNVNVQERTLSLRLPGTESEFGHEVALPKSSSIGSLQQLKMPVPGMVKYLISDIVPTVCSKQNYERGPSGLLRFFESPVFNIHFAVHYLFYSKEPGVLSFIGNKIFSFPDHEVDLYIPQLIVMYIQMEELAEVLDPYLTIRCRKSVDFSLKCLWLLEAYNYQVDSLGNSSNSRKSKLALMKEIFSKKEKSKSDFSQGPTLNFVKKTHHRSQSDATVLLADSRSPHMLSTTHRIFHQSPYTTQMWTTTPAKLCLGDLTSGRAFDNGCSCFETVRGQVNGLLGHQTLCNCGAPKTAPQKEFMKSLMNVGKNLTSLTSKAEKTSALRMFLNLINKNLPARVWLPLYSDIPHHVVRITEEKTAVLNSKDKTPYIIYVEVVEVADIYTSPLIPKMMPSLRHTKSEEHLEGACLNTHQSYSQTTSCSSIHNGSSCRWKKANESYAENGDPPAHNIFTHNNSNLQSISGLQLHEDDVWSQEDDEITAQYLNMRKISERDAVSQMSLDSCDSRDQGQPTVFNIGDVRIRHSNNLSCENTKPFCNDPEDPSAAALKEPWHEKEKLIRDSSPYGHLSNWRLLSAIVKCGDDLRQELMATQLLQMFKIIWLEEHVDLWVRPYKIICLSNDSGLIEPILNTVSLHQIKKNSNKSLRDYFIDEYGEPTGQSFRQAQKNFVQSCAAYCLISYLLQVKDRHNGNILFHSDGHIIHIDFGFILSISPKNLGFEQSPFKLTHEFVDVMGGTESTHWREFNRLLLVGMMSARKHMDRIINFVEIMRSNAHLPCFKNGCSGTVQNLRKRFHMNLTEKEMERKVEQLVQDSLKSLSTKLYDGYQYYTNGIL